MKKQLRVEELDRIAERTEEDLDRLAEQLDSGESPALRIRRGPGRPPMGSGPAEAIRVRLDPDLRRAVAERAQAQGVTDSDIVRSALRRYLEGS